MSRRKTDKKLKNDGPPPILPRMVKVIRANGKAIMRHADDCKCPQTAKHAK